MKYELTNNTKVLFGITLYQIKALVDIESCEVSKGDLGGWIEKESNLSHTGNAWVFGNAIVSGNAKVYRDAKVHGNAIVSGNAKVYGDTSVSRTPKVLSGFIHDVLVTDHHVTVGCQHHLASYWRSKGKAIIRAEGYTKEEAEMWSSIINQLAEAHGCTDPEGENI